MSKKIFGGKKKKAAPSPEGPVVTPLNPEEAKKHRKGVRGRLDLAQMAGTILGSGGIGGINKLGG